MKKSLMKRTLTAMLLALTSTLLWAQIPDGYYNNAEGKTGTELRAALHNIIKNHHVVSYDGLLYAYAYTDCDADMKIIDIYSNYHFDINGNCGTYHREGDCWNREHTWPQSWFGSGTPKSDLFHVYPTDGFVNGIRGNLPYGEVKGNANYTSTNGCKRGSCDPALGYTSTVFEPADEYKGDIARSFFYMSTRYYTEDNSWKNSEMTSKCNIKPWALKMLLKWSDEDPVSQKEINRNNVIYDSYQYNRNPFIDHPEYAHMIWDENWTEGTTYDITCATNLQHGSVSAPAKAAEGSTVSITALPDAGYMVDTYSAWKTGSTATTINVSTTGTFTMPAYAVTVSATFKQNNTLYNIAVADTKHGTVTASATKALSGSVITLTTTPDEGYVLSALHVYKTGTSAIVPLDEDNTFTMPAYDVTVSATFNQPGQIAFEKVTTELSDWSGDYLIVYEAENVALNSALETLDAANNTISITTNGNIIEANDATNAAAVSITPVEGGYAIKAANGKYIGHSSSKNELPTSDTPLVNTLQYSSNSEGVDIKGQSGYTIRFNKQSGQMRFRYYKTGQEPVQLYKRIGQAEPIATHTITFHNGSQTKTQTVDDMQPTTLMANTFTKSGFEFGGWTTNDDGTGEYYEDEATVTLMDDLDLYALWDQLFNVKCLPAEGGSITATPATATEGSPITITVSPQASYQLQTLTVTDSQDN
jgi:endonuclease I